ncbi:MAG TPA: YggT family protein [Rhizomicrobium sp.]|nr:YggT family protein [Rhizomicrobium sp.]
MGGFLEYIIVALLQLLVLAIIISAILSWLVAFDVVNLRHPVARQIVVFLDAVTRPILRPIQRVIPPLGGFDISPIIAIIVLQAAEQYLVPWVFSLVAPVIG